MSPADGAPPAPPPDSADGAALPAGYPVNEYVIERTLGGGGFGITYLAHDVNLALPVAIKEYFPADLASRSADQTVLLRAESEDNRATYEWGLERFLDEARALATFRHPNIVRVLRYFRGNGTAYIVMEYETGVSLKRWVPQHAPLSRQAVLSIVMPLLDGLEQVHSGDFLHRDIKPDNIYVRANNTPVLLDFGSARRVSGNQELTNIVSPGFAPFEQYHSHGSQGPWSDIYSLGAVMYWMVTGKKPMESAARVKTDSMLPASKLADAGVYGHEMLGAIDWALQPDESKRPQSVSALRRILQPDDLTRPAHKPGSAPAAAPVDAQAMTAAAQAPSQPGFSDSNPSLKRTLLGTILYLDLVGFSGRSVTDQVAIKKLFTELIAKSLRGVAESTRIVIDTGEGAAICFMGDPEEALNSARLLRDLLSQRYGSILSLRLGLHMGPVRIVSDMNSRTNVIGDGINVAQRVMDFAQSNQILVSRAYYDVISRITDDTADMFQYLGQFEDKHGRMHELYSVGTGQKNPTTRREGPSTGYTQTVPAKVAALEDADVHEVEVELARHIGPLARILVGKARSIAGSLEELREALAPTIQEPKARELFRSGWHAPSQPPGSRSAPLSRPATTRPKSVTTPSRTTGATQTPSIPMPRSATQSATRPVDLAPEELAAIEQALSRFIGPMARIVVKKQSARTASFKELVSALVESVDQPGQRDAFVAALHKALPRRSF